MAGGWKAPPQLKEPYSSWKTELEIWQNFTDIPEKKQGGALFLSLPNPSSARDAVLELGSAVINAEDAITKITAKLDTLFLKDDNVLAYQAWKRFMNLKRPSNMSISDYAIEFNRNYNILKAKKLELPEGILAFQFLESSNLPESEHKLCLATCTAVTYEAMKSQVIKVHQGVCLPSSTAIAPAQNIKIESDSPALQAEYCDQTESEELSDEYHDMEAHDTLYGYRQDYRDRRNQRGSGYRGNQRNNRGRSSNFQRRTNQNRFEAPTSRTVRAKQMNPPDKYGRPLQCKECYSIYHFADKCPEVDNNIVLLTDETSPTSLLGETLGRMVVDSGCIQTVCGQAWLDSYMESLSHKDKKSIVSERSSGRYRFGSGALFKSLKRVTLPVYLGKLRTRISTDVVECEIPLLLSKNSLKKGGGTLDFVSDRMKILGQDLNLSTTSSGHYYLELSRSLDGPIEDVRDILFAIKEGDLDSPNINKTATKWHKQFGHPPAHKLKELLNRAKIHNKELNNAIEKVTDNCTTCIIYKKPPTKPIVAFPLASHFNQTVALDLKDIRPGLKILHLIDHATRYAQASVVKNKTSTEIVKKIFDSWIRIFGCPEQFLTDNGGEFNNGEFLELCDKCNIKILSTAAESPWSNGMVEKHNGVLGRMVEKLLSEDSLDGELAVHWSVAAKNSLATVYGFSPNTLVFGRDPSIPNVFDNKLPANDPLFYSTLIKNNIDALHRARESFIQQEASEKLSRALKRQTRTYLDQPFCVGDEVFYKRDVSSKWQGPATVLGVDGKQVLIKHGSSYIRVHPCRLTHTSGEADILSRDLEDLPCTPQLVDAKQGEDYSSDEDQEAITENPGDTPIMPCHEELPGQADTEAPTHNAETPTEAYPEIAEPVAVSVELNNIITQPQGKPSRTIPKKNQEIKYKLTGEEDFRTGTCLGRAGKATSARTWHYVNVLDHTSNTERSLSVLNDMDSWEVMPEVDVLLTEKDEAFNEPKMAELRKWSEMNVYTEVDNEGQQSISCRWVCTERLKAGKKELKARLCARGCEDVEDVPTDSPTCERDNVRLLLTIAVSHGWSLHSIDIKSAYLQGEPLDRDIYLVPPKEAKTDSLWKLNRCVYGINDAGKRWYNQFKHELVGLGASVSKLDQAVFFARNAGGGLEGVMVVHVDDTLWAGTDRFETSVIRPLKEKFLVSSEEHNQMRYLGLTISETTAGAILNLDHYSQRLQEIEVSQQSNNDDDLSNDDICKLRMLSGQFNWLSGQTRPDIAYNSCHIACSISGAKIQDLKYANKIVRRVKGSSYNLTYLPLGSPCDWKILCYSDASWGNLRNGGSQGGYLVFLMNSEGRINLISWQSHRLKRIARSTVAAGTLSAMEACETAFLLKSQISEIFDGEGPPIHLVTDNESLANAVRSTTSVEEKRLRVDISALREMLDKGEIREVSWVPAREQLADCLTKQGANSENLIRVLKQQMRFDQSRLCFVPAW